MSIIPARLGLQQRVLPEYRVPFFDALATASLKGLSVFSGNPRPTEAIEIGKKLAIANHYQALNIHLFRREILPLLAVGFGNLAANLESGRADRGSKPALSGHAAGNPMDAPPQASGPGVGIGNTYVQLT